LFVAVYKPMGWGWSNADIIGLLSFRTKSLLASDLNTENPFGMVKFQTLQARNSWTSLIIITFKFQCLSHAPTIHHKEMGMYLILVSIKMSNCQMSLLWHPGLRSPTLLFSHTG
jgi:hypothetical protein